ncbi:hypothetical protein L9F63_018149, partial [Diploptera punctata]
MALVRSDILRCGVRVVCEIMIAELKDMLKRKQQRQLLQMKNKLGNVSTGAVPKGHSPNKQELLQKKQMEDQRKMAKKKMLSNNRRKKSGKPEPVTVVSVEGNMAEPSTSNEEQGCEVILPDDPLGNIQIKQEIEDDNITFEEHFEDMVLPPIKTEVKDELVYEDPDEMDTAIIDSSSCDTYED